MATVQIPIDGNLSSQKMLVQLDGIRYGLHAYYSFRQASWLLDMTTDSGEPLLLGLKLVPEYPLIGHLVNERLPPGELRVRDVTNAGGAPGRDDFGRGRAFVLLYEGMI